MIFSKRVSTILLSVLIAWSSLFSVTVNAAVVSTASTINSHEQGQLKSQLHSALARVEVQERLQALGVSAADVASRIDALTIAELNTLAAEMDQMPAGAGAVGLLALLVLVFFITDVLGITDIFPFVNAAR
ncbi:MAG: PA2779 family protein [Spongiibacteraceae bacterium]